MIQLCCTTENCFNICFWISTLVAPVITYFIIQGLRPRLKITSQITKNECVKIKVLNKSCFFYANNLRIEVCVFKKEIGHTYHFETDHCEFLILPNKGFFCKRDNSKTFVATKAAESAMPHLEREENNNNLTKEQGAAILISKLDEAYKLRVRCHAYHSFSGLGKSFEEVF